MPRTRTEKDQEILALRERFERAVAAVFVDFRGLDVATVTDLRARFRKAGVEYKVVKNNLVRKALLGSGLEGVRDALDPFLVGPTGVAWTYEDPSAAAKVIKAFRKEGEEQEKLTVKGGLLEGEVLEARRVEGELAALPGKDELRAQLLAQLMAPMQSLVRQLSAPGQNLAYVLEAWRREQEDNGG